MNKLKYVSYFSFLLLVCIAVSGCSNGHYRILDYELYDNGKPKKYIEANYYSENSKKSENIYSHSSEYHENGRLKLEECFEYGKPMYRIEFYDSGQIKSEERFINGKLEYGAYYKEDGRANPTTGQLIDWVTRKRLNKQE